jgi:RsiW-degrading membrane proteinase PrsW (M82 family)
LIDLLTPIVLNPIVLVSFLVIFAIIVPIVEEVFKPIGVWMFASRLKSPAQGFALGALSGAAFSLVETFGSSGQTTDWAGLLTVRIGTSILHITSTALMGWGIALAWQHRQYGKLFLIYLGSCTLHGAWNASALLYSFSALAKEVDSTLAFGRIQSFALVFSSLLAVGMMMILLSMNRKFVKTDALSNQQSPIDSRATEEST